MEEKRRTHRIQMRLVARFGPVDSPDGFTETTTLNINVKGLCLLSSTDYPPGTPLVVQVELPTAEEIVVHAQVIWTRKAVMSDGYLVGVKISDTMKADEAKFVRFYAQQLLDMSSESNDLQDESA